jgi:hypothetical protein
VKRVTFLLWPISVLLALSIGIAVGARVISSIYEPELKAARVERDKAVKDMKYWQDVLKAIVEGGNPEMKERGR